MLGAQPTFFQSVGDRQSQSFKAVLHQIIRNPLFDAPSYQLGSQRSRNDDEGNIQLGLLQGLERCKAIETGEVVISEDDVDGRVQMAVELLFCFYALPFRVVPRLLQPVHNQFRVA
jgi:hypothetical protein